MAFATPVPLQSYDRGSNGYRFDTELAFALEPHASDGWQIKVQMYQYSLLDRNHRELLVYHWQPKSAGPDYPHLHVSASVDAQFDAITRHRIDLDKRHSATGQVTLKAFIRMLITEFQIKPLRSDWEARLKASDSH